MSATVTEVQRDSAPPVTSPRQRAGPSQGHSSATLRVEDSSRNSSRSSMPLMGPGRPGGRHTQSRQEHAAGRLSPGWPATPFPAPASSPAAQQDVCPGAVKAEGDVSRTEAVLGAWEASWWQLLPGWGGGERLREPPGTSDPGGRRRTPHLQAGEPWHGCPLHAAGAKWVTHPCPPGARHRPQPQGGGRNSPVAGVLLRPGPPTQSLPAPSTGAGQGRGS